MTKGAIDFAGVVISDSDGVYAPKPKGQAPRRFTIDDFIAAALLAEDVLRALVAGDDCEPVGEAEELPILKAIDVLAEWRSLYRIDDTQPRF